MKLFDFLNLGNISGQIAALVITSIVAIHLILAAIFLVSRPDQPDPVSYTHLTLPTILRV